MSNWHEKHREQSSVPELISDVVAKFAGSWWFVGIHALWFGAWIIFHAESYPYGLLTLSVSLEAIFLSTFVMMNQDRSGDRDRVQAEEDYKTNREAKLEIEILQKALARVEDEKLDKIIELLHLLTMVKVPIRSLRPSDNKSNVKLIRKPTKKP